MLHFEKIKTWSKSYRGTIAVAVLSSCVSLAASTALYYGFSTTQQRLQASTELTQSQIQDLPSRKDLTLALTASEARVEKALAFATSGFAIVHRDEQKTAEHERSERDRLVGLKQKDDLRTLCQVCRRGKNLTSDTTCLANGCFLQATIDFHGQEFSVPVLPFSDRSSGASLSAAPAASPPRDLAGAGAGAGAGTVTAVQTDGDKGGYPQDEAKSADDDLRQPPLLYLRNGVTVEQVAAADLKVLVGPQEIENFSGFIIDKKFLPKDGEQILSWEDLLEAVKDAKDGYGQISIKNMLK